MMQSGPAYGAMAKAFHWVTAAAVITVVPLGIAMVNAAPGPTQNQLYDLHRSFGATILTLTALRLLWRLWHPAPPLVPGLPDWQRRAARVSHVALYVLLFAVPLLGWAGTSAFPARIMVFGLFELPPILGENRALSETLLGIHEFAAFTLCGVLAIHIAAAFQHHWWRKDETLRRMLPGSG